MITAEKKKKNKFLPDFEKQSIYSLRFDELQGWLKENGQQSFRAKQIYEWLYDKRVDSFEEMTNLSKALRQLLADHFTITTLATVVRQESRDGTIKFLFELQDGYTIETVLIRHDYGNSVCVTTQVGCRIGCTFCASTLGGLKRNLEAGEIVSQVLTVQKALDETDERVSSIVIMGIGEPFENYDEMMDFLKIVNDDHSLNIGARHITVSTSGIVPRIYDFADESLQINFAVSLHAANNEIRSKLMPINRAYDVDKLMEAIQYYQEKTKRRITFEYGLFGGVNDQLEHARELAKLIKPLNCHVNLIPVNHVPERNYVKTPKDDIFKFEKELKKLGINATIRREQGADIDAACGQLRAKERQAETRQNIMLNAEFFSVAGDFRENNEDAGGVFYNKTEQQFLVLCDGMGGHQAGEVASQFVVDALQERFEAENYIEPEQAEAWLKHQLQIVNRDLYDQAQQNPEYHGMGTTCVCALVFDHHIVVANVGDSRAYLTNGRTMDQITIDHTFVNQLVMLGEITEEEAFVHPRRHIITKVMGTNRFVTPDIFTKRTQFYQYLILNSDGLTDYVKPYQLHELLNEGKTIQEIGDDMLAVAEEQEAKDNVSFILAEIAGEPV